MIEMGNNGVRLSLKLWNWVMGVGGIVTIMYAVFMFRVWQQTSSSAHLTIPWFFHGILFVGIVLCAVTLLGHLAASTANCCCLSTYIVVILLLLVFETVIISQALLHPTWEKELPVIVSDKLDDLSDSTHMWKILGSLIFIVQGVCVLLAAVSIHKPEDIDDSSESEGEDEEEPALTLFDTVPRWQLDERRIAIL